VYIEETLGKYITDASAGTPTPGGGSVSALAGALGTTMASMAANFTMGKKQFAAVEGEVKDLAAKIESERRRMITEMQRDTEAYAEVSKAYKMPKEPDEAKASRAAAIQKALLTAMGPPLEALRAMRRVAPAIRRLADIANPNLITDVGVAALLVEAAARGAALNVRINLAGMKDAARVEAASAEVKESLGEISRLAAEATGIVEKSLK